MIPASLSSFFRRDTVRLEKFGAAPSLWRDAALTCAHALRADLDADTAIGTLQQARRLIRIFTAGLENSSALRTALEAAPLTDWADFTSPPVPEDAQKRLGDMLYIVGDKAEVPLLELGDQTRLIGPHLFDRCVADGLDFDISVSDENFMAVLLGHCDDDAIGRLAGDFIEARAGITARILALHNLPVWESLEPPQDRQKLYRSLLAPYRARVMGGGMKSVLTSIPTARDAAIDGIPYAAYTRLYFAACDQPWDAIKAAQYRLIETLNAAKILRFTNNDGTDLSMNVEGFTFCNSVIARNIPGSEVFSAPRIDSTNGTIIARGRFSAKDSAGAMMEDLTLTFRDGVLTEAVAAQGQDHLDRAVGTDDGARRIGEIGIGTNPYLKRHVSSILLSEKIGGSFHVALGNAYTMTDYMGDPVVVDNGNRSQLHWDITTMLIGKQGRIYADGVAIMTDGLFTDPALDVLNRGWAAVAPDARPHNWQDLCHFEGEKP